MPEDHPSPTPEANAERLDKLEIAERVGLAMLTKSQAWAVSIVLLIVSCSFSFAGVFWLVGDKILAFQQSANDIHRLKDDHDHCIMEVTELKARVSILESKSTAANP